MRRILPDDADGNGPAWERNLSGMCGKNAGASVFCKNRGGGRMQVWGLFIIAGFLLLCYLLGEVAARIEIRKFTDELRKMEERADGDDIHRER